VAETKKAAEGEDIAAMKAATEKLGEAIQKIGASVYEQNPGAGAGPEAGSSSSDDGGPEVVDGEVHE